MNLKTISQTLQLGGVTAVLSMALGQSGNALAEAAAQAKPHNALLHRSDAVLLLVDEQVGLLSGVRDIATGDLSRNVAALVKVAKLLDVPIIVTAVGPGNLWGPVLPEISEALPNLKVIRRTVINAWDDPQVVAAVKATGRHQLLVAGISLEVCAALPALAAKQAGFDSRVVLDASGTFNEAKRVSGIQRLTVEGVATASVELMGDNADPKANEVYAALNLSFSNIVWQLNAAAKADAKAGN
jgi:nicotinamidase-related amidase